MIGAKFIYKLHQVTLGTRRYNTQEMAGIGGKRKSGRVVEEVFGGEKMINFLIIDYG